MNAAARTPSWSALQTAAVLLLCRLTLFFCCDQPYTAAYAKGMLAAALTEAVLLLPLAIFRRFCRFPPAMMWIYRVFSLISAAFLAAEGFRLLHALHSAQPALFAAMFLLTLLFTVSRPQAATARAAVILLVTVSTALLLLPVSGIRTANPVSLHMPGSVSGAFFREFRCSPELALLPVLLSHPKKQEQYAPHALAVWLIGRLAVLPGLVLFGTMQNGRLTRGAGSPFFLMLAGAPLSDAVRTDGFWMLFAAGSAVLCVSFFLQLALPPSRRPVRALLTVMLLFTGLTWLCISADYRGTGLGIAALLLGALLPGVLLPISRTRRQKS
ncbi:MAG: hypothetical protein IJ060_02360 [Oscillospiraceae bacterium]|nr:hypothetical protein [Oscillospiraceae bacterium]